MRYPYHAFPLDQTDPVTKLNYAWKPTLKVLISYNQNRSALLESIVDSGADHSLFNAEIGEALGIPIRKGQELPFSGIGKGAQTVGYVHRVKLTVAAQSYEVPVVFAYGIVANGVLGQAGFFDHFIVTFDWSQSRPFFDVQRIPRN